MSTGTAIEWTDATWNPVTGCDRVSAGCDHCYALTLARRLKSMGNPRYQNDGRPETSGPGFGVTLHPDKLDEPLRWRKPRRVFVNSMSDLFHADVPRDFIAQMFVVMALSPQHVFQVLTKRPGRMKSLVSSVEFWAAVAEGVEARNPKSLLALRKELAVPDDPSMRWLPNVWLGVSCEDQDTADKRIPLLLETPAAIRFVSAEPLLEPIDLWQATQVRTCAFHPGYLNWVIVGGESGPDARPMHPDWVRSLRSQCESTGVAFFFKQWGGRTPKAGGRGLDGRTWDEFPVAED